MDNQPQEQTRPEWEQAWAAMQQSPEFQAADDKEREAMRNSVYHNYIENRLPTRLKKKAKDMFDERTKPEGDPDSGILSDIFHMTGAGAVEAFADLAAAPTLGKSNRVSDWLSEKARDIESGASPSMIKEAQDFGVDYNAEQGLHLSEGSTFKGFMGAAFKGGGSMLSLAPAGVVGRGAGMALNAIGKAGKMEKALVATNNMANARKAMAIAERKMIDRATRASYGVTMGGQMGGGTGRQAELEVMEKSEEELKKSPQYNEYLKIMSPQQAREKLAGDAAESQFWPAAGLGTVSGMIVGPAMEEIAMGSKLGAKAVSRPMNALKGGVTEMGQEMVESGGQQILSNVAQQDVGLQVDTMAGVPKATLTGMAVGGVSGAAMGGAFKHKPPNREQIDQDLNDANVKVQALEADLKQPDLSDKDKATTEANLEKAYRRVVDLEGVQQSLIEAAEKQAKADAKKGKAPKPSEPETKPSESTAKPSESEPPADPNAPWVATDIDNQIADLSRDIRQQESNFKRTLQNGGKVEDAEILERQMGKQKALLNRLQSLSRHRDKQSLFDKKEDFYSWIDLTTGTPDDQVEASLLLRNQGRRKALEASVPGLARRAQAAAKRGAKGELLDQVADRKLARGIKAAMKEEQYQSLDESLPSHEDIKHEQKQIKRKELAHRVTESGAHRDPFRWKRRKEHRERELKRTRAVPETIAGFHTETTPKEFLVRSGQDHLKKFGPQGLGGLYDRRRGGWVFPRQRRTTVAKALEQWQPRPSGRPATRKPRYSTERISNLTNKPAQPATVTPIEEARAKTETPPAPVVESKPKQEKSVEPAVKKEKPATKEPPPVQKKEPVEKKVTPKPEEPPPRESTAKKSEKVPKEQPAAETKPKEPTPESKAFGTTKSAPDYEAREQVKQQSAANLRRKFLDQYVGNKGDAPYAFVGSLIHNDYEKALDDVHRERLTPDTAIATANKAVEAGAMDRESADWFIKKLKEQVPEVPETKSKEPVNTLSDKELEQGILDRTFNAFTDAMKEGTSKDDYRGGAKRLAQAIKDKNVEYLLTVLDQGRDGNKGSKAAFQWATGQEGVGLTAKANRDAVYRWAGWTEQQIEQRKQNRQKQLEEEARQRHEEHAVDLANRTSMRVDGVDMTIKEWVDKRLSEGFTELYNKGKKVPQYFLREPGTTSGYELSHFGKYKGAKGYSKIALDYARIAISRLDRHQPSNNGQIKQAEPHSVSTLRGDKTAIQDQIREGLLKGERFSDEYTTYWIEDRSQVKGGGWVMVTKPLDGGYGSTKGGTGRGAWSQQEAAGRVIQDMDYAITEASKNARMSLDDMGKDFKQELLEKARKFRDDLREGWFTSDQLRAKLHVFISDYIWQKAPEHIDLDEATPSALAKDLIYQLHREVTPKPTRLPEAANDWVHNDRYVWEYATKLIDHGFDPEPFYEVKDDMKKVREAIKKTITDFKETTTTQPTEATPQPTSIPDSFSQAFKEVTPDQPVTVIDLKGRAFQEAHTWLKTLTEERSPNHRRQWSYNDWVISTPTSGGINYFT
ncbi:MAG: hypothetical protein N0C82_20460, partial [Candidatus Thiodiazotropha endolucinida]|nr:hypothetical protein [Candidatus Thiodiazotropha taylori]MCW4297678.1 hypothetical protein [Candidatus Thiodiazotropha endolucinida]